MLLPLSLYIHIPWCIKKCPYCDFNSHTFQNGIPQEEYVQALLTDFKNELPHIQNREIQSIFIGGGTPSLFAPKNIKKLLYGISNMVELAKDIEITMEANPGTVEHYNFAEYVDAGINRISLGVQSFNDNQLTTLGRIHKSNETKVAISKIQQLPLKSFNLDIMHTLPKQTLTEALSDLESAINANAPHISWYQLTIEPNTIFNKYPPILPKEDAAWDIFKRGQDLLQKSGFIQYEVSAYSKPEHTCRHNINYWEFGDYIGIGAGAHGKITDAATKIVKRTWKTRTPKDYLIGQQMFLAGDKELSTQQVISEYMLNRLRLYEPLNFESFEKYTNLTREEILSILAKNNKPELFNYNNNTLELTKLGRLFLNDAIAIFL